MSFLWGERIRTDMAEFHVLLCHRPSPYWTSVLSHLEEAAPGWTVESVRESQLMRRVSRGRYHAVFLAFENGEDRSLPRRVKARDPGSAVFALRRGRAPRREVHPDADGVVECHDEPHRCAQLIRETVRAYCTARERSDLIDRLRSVTRQIEEIDPDEGNGRRLRLLLVGDLVALRDAIAREHPPTLFLGERDRGTPQIVVFDFEGRGAARRLRALKNAHPVTPIVALVSGDEDGDAAYRAGANSCLPRPADAEEWRTLARKLLRYWT